MSDFGQRISPDAIQFKRDLPGPIERVWAFLTESDKRARWLAAGEFELEPGGAVELVFQNSSLSELPDDGPPEKYRDLPERMSFSGQVVRCEPPRLLVHTWNEGAAITEVSYELEERGERVLLTLTHTRLKSDDLPGTAGGWHTHLGILADVLAGRTPQPFWRTHTEHEATYAARLS